MEPRKRTQLQDTCEVPGLSNRACRYETRVRNEGASCRREDLDQTIQGRIRLQPPDRALELGSGELMCLESGIAHDVKAVEESAFLITVSWPGGSAEERHAIR